MATNELDDPDRRKHIATACVNEQADLFSPTDSVKQIAKKRYDIAPNFGRKRRPVASDVGNNARTSLDFKLFD